METEAEVYSALLSIRDKPLHECTESDMQDYARLYRKWIILRDIDVSLRMCHAKKANA